MKNCTFLYSIVFVLLLSGCASVPMADKTHDSQAKSFAPKTNMSNVYINSEHGFNGAGVTWELTLDGQAVGGITNGNFIQLEVMPGNHIISSVNNKKSNCFGSVELDTEAGKNYFIEHDVRAGFDGRLLRQVNEVTGRKQVSGSDLVLLPDDVIQKIAAISKRHELQRKEAAIQRNFARPEKITAPRPIAGNSGKYRSPFTAAGTVALWAQKPISGTDNGSDLAASVGGAVGQQVANKVLENIPFVGGIIGQKIGESAARAATKKNIEPELPDMDAVIASSDISFNSADKLAVYMYAKNSAHGQYARVLALAQKVYPELQDAYTPAIEKASQHPAPEKKKAQTKGLMR
jgi:hypothetical protein